MESFELVNFGLDDFSPIFWGFFVFWGGLIDGFLAEEEKVEKIIFGVERVIFEYDLANWGGDGVDRESLGWVFLDHGKYFFDEGDILSVSKKSTYGKVALLLRVGSEGDHLASNHGG